MYLTIKKRKEKKTDKTKYVGDCSPSGIAKRAAKVYKMSNAKNTLKTGNKVIDFALGQNKIIKKWNQGFNLGKMAFVAQQTYNDTCKRKK